MRPRPPSRRGSGISTSGRAGDYACDRTAFAVEPARTWSSMGHAWAGCLHVRPLADLDDHAAAVRLLAAAPAVADLVACAALGDDLYARCEAVKQTWDPAGVLNPGRIVGGTDPVAWLR